MASETKLIAKASSETEIREILISGILLNNV